MIAKRREERWTCVSMRSEVEGVRRSGKPEGGRAVKHRCSEWKNGPKR